jgi:hypothetical protein
VTPGPGPSPQKPPSLWSKPKQDDDNRGGNGGGRNDGGQGGGRGGDRDGGNDGRGKYGKRPD